MGHRKLCGVTLADQIRNEEIRRMAGLKESVIIKMHKGMLRWFGHVERMEDERLTKKIYNAKRVKEEAADDPDYAYEDQIKRVLSDGKIKKYLLDTGVMYERTDECGRSERGMQE